MTGHPLQRGGQQHGERHGTVHRAQRSHSRHQRHGTLGRLVVAKLRDAGREVRVLTRRSREAGEGVEFLTGDLATGEGIEAAVQSAEIIVHCARTQKPQTAA